MKSIILIITLLYCSLCGYGQKPNFKFSSDSTMEISIRIGDSPFADGSCWVRISSKDSAISIHGDTMKVIRMLLDRLNEQYKKQEEYYDFMAAAVEFTNQVPDIWRDSKNNCKWPKYYSLLKKNGFRQVKSKKPYLPCK